MQMVAAPATALGSVQASSQVFGVEPAVGGQGEKVLSASTNHDAGGDGEVTARRSKSIEVKSL